MMVVWHTQVRERAATAAEGDKPPLCEFFETYEVRQSLSPRRACVPCVMLCAVNMDGLR